ncbi:MAG: glycoside hydrolase family 3 C-terminal domain-containing protein [Peptostreptococcaceae bacterium]|nr:glycoside hydrolase family 3 C-terminal domain-containing protein [Peptostreptococcaceae bacterium]
MSEYIKFDNIDQITSMTSARLAKVREAVLQEIKRNPPVHLNTEWGCLAAVSNDEVEDFITNLMQKMSLTEKVNQMSADYTPAISTFIYDRYNSGAYYAGEDIKNNIPAIKFTDGPTGVVMGYHSTAFPVSIARAATFDKELEQKIGDIIGIESKAGGANFFAGVCMNLLRHPGWGRAQESYGEDPFVQGEMGSALTIGVQNHVMACIKHFAANSIENARFRVSVELSERVLREMYLPHFKKCIDSGAASVMSAYNKLRGEWCGHNAYLLSEILKKEWGFQGFVMSDFGYGIRGTVDPANAGLDIEMNTTQFYGHKLVEAVENGEVAEDKIDDAVRRILREKIRFAHVEEGKVYSKSDVGNEEHAKIALEAARKSAVLLKNEGLLPFKKNKFKKILVVGDQALLGSVGDCKGSSAVYPSYIVSALDGIKKAAGSEIEVEFVRGIIPDEVRQKGKNCDVVVVFVGLTHLDEGEYFLPSNDAPQGGDRLNLSLHATDIEIIEAATEGNENTLVVLQGGSAIQVEPWCNDVKAILMQWYPGMEGGTALGEIIFGEVNPSGKLPVTIHATPQQLPYFGLHLDTINYDYYHGYFAADKYNQKVTYPFGYGLSYTQYEYSSLCIEAITDKEITISVDVQNVGQVDGEEIIEVYVGYINPIVERHIKDLRGFKRVSLAPGEKKKVEIFILLRELAYYNDTDKNWKVDPITYIAYVGGSSDNHALLHTKFELQGRVYER